MKTKTKTVRRVKKAVVVSPRRRAVRVKPTAGAAPLSRKEDLIEPRASGTRQRSRSLTAL